MGTLQAYARASHFGPTVAVTAFATVLAVGAGRGAGAAWTALAVLAGQLSVGWSNDWVDRHRDRAAGRSEKPLVAGAIADESLARAAVAALALAVVLSLVSGLAAAAAHAVALTLAWSYNLGLKGTRFSVLPYAGAFALLPAFVTLAPPRGALPPVWAMVAGALLGAGAHFTNTLADVDADSTTGVHGLPQRIGPRASVLLAALCLGGGALAVAVGVRPLPPLAAWALAVTGMLVVAVVVAGAKLRGRVAFRLTIAAAGAVVVAFVAAGL